MENCKCIFATLFSSLLSVLSPSLSSAENYCASVHNAGRRLELLRTEKGVLKRTGVSLEFGLESAASLRTFPFWKGGLKSLFIISQKPVGRLLGPGWFCAAEAAAAAEINYFVPFPLLLASLMCSFKAFVCTHWTIRSSQNEEEFWISLLFWILPIFGVFQIAVQSWIIIQDWKCYAEPRLRTSQSAVSNYRVGNVWIFAHKMAALIWITQ